MHRRALHHTVLFYGRRGQKQYGLDIVEYARTGTVVYQVKRFQTITATQLRAAVVEYATAPRPLGQDHFTRRFNAKRFVVVTSAVIDDTAVTDELAALKKEYAGDLEIDLWGPRHFNALLRDSPGFVTAVFGPAWSLAFCGTTAPAPPPGAPDPLGLVDGPVQALGLTSRVLDAEQLTDTDPATATALYASIAVQLNETFPGHAAQMRLKQADAARAAGDRGAAFALRFHLLLDPLLRGDEVYLHDERDLGEEATTLSDLTSAKWTALSSAASWPEHSLNLPILADAVTRLTASQDPDAAALCCLALEHALVDGLFDFVPARSFMIALDEDSPAHLQALRTAATTVSTRDVIVRTRLRCAVADANLLITSSAEEVETAYREVLEDATDERLHPAGGLVHSRAAYAFATHGDLSRAERMWRRAVIHSSRDGFYGDARNALRALRTAYSDARQLLDLDVTTLTQAMPNRRQLLEGRPDPAAGAFESAQLGKLPEARGACRRWQRQARLSGHLNQERLARRQHGRVLLAADEPHAAVECFVTGGDVKQAAATAMELPRRSPTWIWTTSQQQHQRAAAIAVARTQTALIPDAEVPAYALSLLTLTADLWNAPSWCPTRPGKP